MFDSRVQCFGYNWAPLQFANLPHAALPLTSFPLEPTKIAVGSYSHCAILPKGTVACAGSGERGQIGDPAYPWSSLYDAPFEVTELVGPVVVSLPRFGGQSNYAALLWW